MGLSERRIGRKSRDGRLLPVADRSTTTHSCQLTILTPDVHEGRLPTCRHSLGLGARPPASSRPRKDLNRARFYAMLLSPTIVRKMRACAGDQPCCPFLRRRHDCYVENSLQHFHRPDFITPCSRHVSPTKREAGGGRFGIRCPPLSF